MSRVAGAGEDWLSNSLDDVLSVEAGLWISDVDYIAGWRAARVVADRLNRALLAAGFELSTVRAVASTDESGRGVIRLAGWPDAVDLLAAMLEARADGGAA